MLLLLLSASAHAQQESAGPLSQDQASDVVQLDPVTVTTRFRPEDEQQVPVSMAVVSGEAIQDEGRFSLGDLDSRVANLQLGDLNGTPTIFMRGVGGGGRQIGFEPRTGLYVDGVFMNEPPLADTLLLDLDRVEVLLGPQGSLFGQNTDAGAISLITREPGESYSVKSLTRVDDRGERRIAEAADVPLIDDRLLLRVSGNYAQSDGFTTNVFDDSRPDAFKEAGGRLRLQWRIAPGLRADFAADTDAHFSAFPTGEARSSTNGKGPDELPTPYTVDLNTPQRDDRRSSGLATTIDWNTAIGTLTSISAWRDASRIWAIDLDYSAVDGESSNSDDRYRRWSQELRLASPESDSPLKWLAGLYGFRQIADSDRPVIAGSQIQMFVPPLHPGDVLTVLPKLDTRSVSLFGTLGYALRPDLRVDAGLRLVTVERWLDYTQQSSAGYQSLGFAQIDPVEKSDRENAVLPDLALSWDLRPSLTAYARYARGSKSGGYDADVLSGNRTSPESFSPEKVNSYELGLKGQWLQHRLGVNLAMFLADYKDYQVSQFQTFGSIVLPVISNAGEVRTDGPELELLARPLAGLTLRTSAAWLDAKYVEFRNGGGAGVDYSGNRTEYAPRWSVDSAAEYRRSVQWGAVAGVMAALSYDWRSDFYTTPSNQPLLLADDRRLLGARIGVLDAGQHFELSLYGNNLLDDRYSDTLNRGTLGTIYGRYGAPRTIGMQMRLSYD